jgi:hypothetical protein
MIKDLVG